MSYILDALKKAERERGIIRMPSLTTARQSGGVRKSKAAAIAGVLVCVIVVLAYFLSNTGRSPERAPIGTAQDAAAGRQVVDQSAQLPSNNTTVPPATRPVESTPRETASADNTEVPAARGGVGGAPSSRSITPGKPRRGPAQVSQEAGRAGEAGGSETDSQPRAAESVAGASAGAVAQPANAADSNAGVKEPAPVPGEIQTKPLSLKEAMSKMTLNILVYDDSEAARRVVINGRRYAKGDYVDGHYLIEDITLEGAVLSYDGERAVLRPR